MNARRLHRDGCSCSYCTYDRAGLTPPIPTVRPVWPVGLSIAMDQIAETVAAHAPDDWSGSREDARRAAGGVSVGDCAHWNARNVWLCPDCGEDWEDCQ